MSMYTGSARLSGPIDIIRMFANAEKMKQIMQHELCERSSDYSYCRTLTVIGHVDNRATAVGLRNANSQNQQPYCTSVGIGVRLSTSNMSNCGQHTVVIVPVVIITDKPGTRDSKIRCKGGRGICRQKPPSAAGFMNFLATA